MTGHFICQACGIAILDQVCHECGGMGTFVPGLTVEYHSGQLPPQKPVIQARNIPPHCSVFMKLKPVSRERAHQWFDHIRQSL